MGARMCEAGAGGRVGPGAQSGFVREERMMTLAGNAFGGSPGVLFIKKITLDDLSCICKLMALGGGL